MIGTRAARVRRAGALLLALTTAVTCSPAPQEPTDAGATVSAPQAPVAVAPELRRLMGVYGQGDAAADPILLERDGGLVLRSGDGTEHPVEPARAAADGDAVELRGSTGGAVAVWHGPQGDLPPRLEIDGREYTRRLGVDEGPTFRIEPVRPVAELRPEALAAEPPAEPDDLRPPDLVDLAEVVPGIRLDIRYASTNNFMGAVFYQQARAFMQRPAAAALGRVQAALADRGYGLLVFDAYRPWFVTKMFWDATPEHQKHFVADPAQGSRHNRGCAVDLTLVNLATGEPVEMTGGYDEFSERSYPGYPGGTSRQRWHRELLRDAMEAEGFAVYEYEWWHFDHGDWPSYPILDEPFEALDAE